jgi:hypothetical protein
MAKRRPDEAPVPAAPRPPSQERFYRVTKTCRIARGATYYTLPVGKVLSSLGYDIDELCTMGVTMEAVDSPVMRPTVLP